MIVNALAVTSVTSERDGRSLDLLLVTDIRPAEFLFGKMGGVFWITKEMVVLPLLVCVGLWWVRGIGLENLSYLICGLLVLNGFAATLGLHCGMIYSNSRTAIGVSLGTLFVLFLGVGTCILMMVSFSGSFEVQLAPFLAFILGGGVGLYVSLGVRNPSAAIGLASLIVPFATFYAAVSFLLDHFGLTFVVTAGAYGFSTAAMLVPALHEFDFAGARSPTGRGPV
jgi:ABC-type Na+ efflux pump permease subunit